MPTSFLPTRFCSLFARLWALVLVLVLGTPLAVAHPAPATVSVAPAELSGPSACPSMSFRAGMAALEKRTGFTLGLAAVHGTRTITWRAQTRFAFCSTFKLFLVAELLRQTAHDPGLLDRKLVWEEAEEQDWSPCTKGRGAAGMRVSQLCEAAITLSDNTAANLLLRLVGGPEVLTRALHTLGDRDFLLTDYEPALNHAKAWPDPAQSLDRQQGQSQRQDQALLANSTTAAGFVQALGSVLFAKDHAACAIRQQLLDFLAKTATGKDRIAAALPEGAMLFHKTGTGYGNVHDLGLVRLADGSELLLVLFAAKAPGQDVRIPEAEVRAGEQAVAAAARLAFREMGLVPGF